MSHEKDPDRVLEALFDFLAENPDYRVGQAIALATLRRTGRFDPFNVEDADLAAALHALTQEARQWRGPEGALAAYLAQPPRRKLVDWVHGLNHWGKHTLARAAFAVAEPCVGAWELGVPEDSEWQYFVRDAANLGKALDALRAFLHKPDAATEAQVHALLPTVRERVEAAELFAEEASGSAELCRKRDQCAAAGRAVLFAFQAATWTPEQATAGCVDEAERQARAAAGPVDEAWGAVRSFLFAHPEATEERARDHIRRVFASP